MNKTLIVVIVFLLLAVGVILYLGVFTKSKYDAEKWNSDNLQILEQFKEIGDDGTISREVLHFFYFPGNTKNKEFEEFISKSDYKIQNSGLSEGNGEYYYYIGAKHSIDIENINKQTKEMFLISEKFGAEYDGWEGKVVK